jgi:hypothetical protein
MMHMRSQSAVTRLFFALFACAQLLLPTAASLADAHELATGPGGLFGKVHIESGTSSNCPRAHPDDCALCKVATHSPAVGHAFRWAPPAAVAQARLLFFVSCGFVSFESHLALARAPPIS